MDAVTTRFPKLPPPWFVHTAWRIHRALYRLSGGRSLGIPASRRGWGALHLTTIGRKSGRQRRVILGYFEDDDALITVAMNGWDEGLPAWWLNLEKHPDAVVRLARKGLAWCAHVSPPGRSASGCGSAGRRSIRAWTITPDVERPTPPWSSSYRATEPVDRGS